MASTRDSTEKPEGFLRSMVYHATEAHSPASKVYVYEAPLRVWHWVNAACIVVLVITGYLIGQPPPSVAGEASSHFLFGNIRMIHFAAGQILAVALVYRIIWVFLGNHHAHQKEVEERLLAGKVEAGKGVGQECRDQDCNGSSQYSH